MKKRLLILLPMVSLLLGGCGANPAPSGTVPEEIPESDVFFTAKNKLYAHHNYTVKVTTTIDGDPQSPYVDRFYNINNKAYYSINSEYTSFYSGYIYQKNQGYVDFDMMIGGSEISPSNFYSTNPNSTVSDVYTYAIERVLDGKFYKEGDKYSCSEKTPIAVLTNLCGFDVTYITAPNKIYATVENESLILTSDFQMWYIDETTVEKVTTNGNVKVEFENVDNTHNSAVEAYIQNPTTTFEARTAWTSSDLSEFNTYFNKRIPPFLEGSTYSLKVGDYYDGYAQETYAIIEDYACGDLSTSYGEALRLNGYTQKDKYNYEIKETSSGGSVIETYSVEMIFTSPDSPYSDDGRTIGHYYPNGVFTVKYKFKAKPAETIDSIAKLNTYLSKSKVRDILPRFPDNGEITRITGFEDRTAYVNQLYPSDPPGFLFVTSTSALIVKLYASKENASAFIDALTPLMADKGFNKDVSSTIGQIAYCDSQDSKVVFTDPNFSSADYPGYEYPGYIQMQIVIYNKYGDIDDPTETLREITISGQTTEYHVGDTFVFDGVVTAVYQSEDTRVVTPTSISSPDMSTAGRKTITVSYTENGKTVTRGYAITVTHEESPTAYTIKYVSGFDGSPLEHVELDQCVLPSFAEPGESVTLTVKPSEGYRFGCYYPDDEIGDVWAQFDDSVVRTKSVTFTMPSYSFTMIIFIEEDDGSPEIDYLTKMTISDNYTKTFETYDEYVFDGTCTVTYESGNTKQVTPTITQYPNMTVAGTYEVILSYEENGVTVKDSIIITVNERQEKDKYTITKEQIDGFAVINLKVDGASKTEAEEGQNVTFSVSVTSGYTLNKVYYIYNGVKTYLTANPMTGGYKFTMPDGPVSIGAEMTPPGILQKLNGTFMCKYNDQNYYEFVFDVANKVGTYTRINYAGGETRYTLNFSISYSAGKVVLKLVSFASGTDNTSFVSGYRLFEDGTIGRTNNSLQFDEDDVISLTMYTTTATGTTETHQFGRV